MNSGAMNQRAAPAHGFSAMELIVTLSIFLLTTAIAVPLVKNASTAYQMRGAVNSVAGAIQATRFQAISNGYLYRIALDGPTSTYQVWTNTCANPNPPCWAKVGGTIPLSGSSISLTLNATTALDFHPSGLVQASTGAMNFSLTYQGAVENITVSNYGAITVSP